MDQFRRLPPSSLELEYNHWRLSGEAQPQYSPSEYILWNNSVWTPPDIPAIRAQIAIRALQNSQFLPPPSYCQIPMNPNPSAHHQFYQTQNSWRNFNTNPQNNSANSRHNMSSNILSLAMNPQGCESLKKKLEEGNPRMIIQVVLSQLIDHIPDLMVHQFGNQVVQTLFKVCTEFQKNQLLYRIIQDQRNFQEICFNKRGAAAVQELLECLTTAGQRVVLVSALRGFAVALAKDDDGHHVLEKCFNLFTDHQEYCKPLIYEAIDHCLELVTNKNGCYFVNHCLMYAQGEALDRLIAKITPDVEFLSGDLYGNYVVQSLIQLRKFEVTEIILSRLHGHFVSLSTDKHASNVVEKCLLQGYPSQALHIINEIASSSDLMDVAQDEYGNYVIQTAILVSKKLSPTIFRNLYKKISENYAFLHSHPNGKHVLLASRKAMFNRW